MKTKHSGWINIYHIPVTDEEGEDRYDTMTGNTIFPTKEDAEEIGKSSNIVDTIKITWEE